MTHEKCLLQTNNNEKTVTLFNDKLGGYLSSMQELLHERCVILKWHQNWVSPDRAELNVVGIEQSSVPVFLFNGKGIAKIFKSVADAEHFAAAITEGFTHVDTGSRDMYYQMISKGCKFKLNLVLKSKNDTLVMCFNVSMVSVRVINSAN